MASYRARRRRAMVAEVRRQGVTDSRVLRAMLEVPRHRFVPAHRADEAYGPGPLPIACGQTISAPAMVGAMAALLELTGRERVLEVGTGSGYAAAVLSRCAREVISIEYHPSLAAGARAALAATGHHVEVRHGDGRAGAPDKAPFDAISVAAMAEGEVPATLLGQLTDRGVLVCPVGHGRRGDLVRMRRDGRVERFMPVSFVPLL
ncbi:protein-L-isoaspartate(D-aspartate) O-methyltransferase [Actinomycetospora callitridis]|uniref:protein-L-isoaspartate(D-aspartate) O-methyltransferase n=1 Tax=Actinomycetospora callitridis TaxID=913944 RepID=UPI0023671370|nr:protein-L-isoaspartate(D-aspartate) O-methyltransferase [Actinomycetospora callitridis]MDD7920770.1 protein-L-isoaspartate(D-aspartate) O-methyltransferase [Actinomycetospora callitridis]